MVTMIETLTDYNIIGIGLALTMLIVGSIIDVWKREIHDYYWIGFGVVGFLLVFISTDLISNLITIGFALIIAPFVIVVWRIGLFGGEYSNTIYSIVKYCSLICNSIFD